MQYGNHDQGLNEDNDTVMGSTCEAVVICYFQRFANPILIALKVFSSNFTISAVSVS